MKLIKVIVLAMLCLNAGVIQATAWQSTTSLPSLTKHYIKKSTLEIIEVLESDYVFPEKAQILAQQLQSKLKANEFNQLDNFTQFIHELGIFIRRVSGDGYLDIIPTQPQLELGYSQVRKAQKNIEGFGFETVEILSGNIGYLKLNHFYQSTEAQLKATQAFDYLSATDAVIIDLRDVAGESISLAHYMMSFFVEPNTILAHVLYDRQTKTEVLTSAENLSIGRFKRDFPVYILTSAFVSGTGEFLSYTLKHLDEASIIGEKTMGVAYLSRKHKIDEFISINMPIAIPIHPVTKTNWEQEGVVPDFAVDAELSFDVAYKLAKEHLNILY
tara:strand:- start:553 stop:1539 length:987 start_codon:yes stop_codon:yes gene_type:complete